MRILIATDGSGRGAKALMAAVRMFAPSNRMVNMMCVVPRVPDHAHQSHRERLYRRAQSIVEKAKATLARAGFAADPIVRTGSPARTLIGSSFSYDVTVVAAASRRDGPMVGLGPVASRLAEHGRGAILLAREGGSESGVRVLVAVDGSEGSSRAIDTLARLVDLAEAEITLLHVVETPWLHAGPDQEWLGYEEGAVEKNDPQAQLQEIFVREGDAILQAARDRLRTAASVETLTREGLPGDEILSEADSGGYDLVVVGESGALDMKHKMLGSVSSKIAWNATCPVLLCGLPGEKE